jgi:NAD(P)-dependent dehydrogenase (short-subunit alcohol dehydrogenase family)
MNRYTYNLHERRCQAGSGAMTRTSVVTGAASGIGAAVAALLEGRGDRVIGVDLAGADVRADLSTPAGREAMVEQVTHLTGGRVDSVIANAGVMADDRGAIVRVNYFGAVATLDGLRPLLAESDAARAVATVSTALIQSVDDAVVALCLAGDEAQAVATVEAQALDPVRTYASTKRALARWVRARSVEPGWAGAGIALNAVAPGVVRTPMTEPLLADPRMADLLLEVVPMPFGGVADAAAVAALLAFLASAECGAVTGQVVFADGGGECLQRGDDPWSHPG